MYCIYWYINVLHIKVHKSIAYIGTCSRYNNRCEYKLILNHRLNTYLKRIDSNNYKRMTDLNSVISISPKKHTYS